MPLSAKLGIDGKYHKDFKDRVRQYTDVTHVESVTDLPTPVSGVITLEAGHHYIIISALDIGTN